MQWIRQRVCITHSITTDKFDAYFTDTLERARSAGSAREYLLDYLSDKQGPGAAVFFSCQKFLEDYEGEKSVQYGPSIDVIICDMPTQSFCVGC